MIMGSVSYFLPIYLDSSAMSFQQFWDQYIFSPKEVRCMQHYYLVPEAETSI
jgi:hypothetical protein